MPKRAKNVNLPYLNVLFYSEGKPLLAVTSTERPSSAPFQPMYGAKMRVLAGADRLAIATTLLEIARDLVGMDKDLEALIGAVVQVLLTEAVSAGGKFIQTLPEDLPF